MQYQPIRGRTFHYHHHRAIVVADIVVFDDNCVNSYGKRNCPKWSETLNDLIKSLNPLCLTRIMSITLYRYYYHYYFTYIPLKGSSSKQNTYSITTTANKNVKQGYLTEFDFELLVNSFFYYLYRRYLDTYKTRITQTLTSPPIHTTNENKICNFT